MPKSPAKASRLEVENLGPFQTLRHAISLMQSSEKLVAVIIVILMIATGIFESFIVALIVPLVYALADPTAFEASRIGQLVNTVLGYSVSEIFPYLVMLLITFLTVSTAMTSSALYISERHAASVTARASRDVLFQVISASYLWISAKNPSVTANIIYDDVRIWRKTYIESWLGAVQSTILIVFPASVVVIMAPFGGILALVGVAIVGGMIILFFRSRLKIVATKINPALHGTIARLHSILHGAREVQVSGRLSTFIDSFANEIRELTAILLLQRAFQSAPPLIVNFLGQLGLLLAGLLIWFSGASPADILAQIALIMFVASRVVPAIGRLSSNLSGVMVGTPRVHALLNLVQEAKANARRKSPDATVPDSWRSLSLVDVSFRYPGRDLNAIDSVSLRIQRGTLVGIVGKSGSGKTTVSNIILGLIEPKSGKILIDDKSLISISIESWHERIGYVPQDPYILNGTLQDNITFGEQFDAERLRISIRCAELNSVLLDLPNGIKTIVGERGRALSGGQAQRVAIARALYRKSDIIIFDEATSALDSITEQKIYESITSTFPNCLMIAVTHRVATLTNFDSICVMDSGKIAAQGSFAELSQRSAMFNALLAGQEMEVADIK